VRDVEPYRSAAKLGPTTPISPPEPGPFDHFRRLASALECPYRGASTLELDRDGRRVRLALQVEMSEVRALVVQAAGGPFTRVLLRAEQDDDREAKRSGAAVEAQIGQRAFDDAIFVDTDASSAQLASLIGVAVRPAVIELVKSGGSIAYDEAGVTLALPAPRDGADDAYGSERLLARIELACTLANAPSFSVASGARRGGTLGAILGFVALILGVGGARLACDWRGRSLVGPLPTPALIFGVGLGLAAGLALRPIWRAYVGRDSDSHRRFQQLFLASSVILAVIGAAGLGAVWPKDPPSAPSGAR
jgi:hypothetical protein